MYDILIILDICVSILITRPSLCVVGPFLCASPVYEAGGNALFLRKKEKQWIEQEIFLKKYVQTLRNSVKADVGPRTLLRDMVNYRVWGQWSRSLRVVQKVSNSDRLPDASPAGQTNTTAKKYCQQNESEFWLNLTFYQLVDFFTNTNKIGRSRRMLSRIVRPNLRGSDEEEQARQDWHAPYLWRFRGY